MRSECRGVAWSAWLERRTLVLIRASFVVFVPLPKFTLKGYPGQSLEPKEALTPFHLFNGGATELGAENASVQGGQWLAIPAYHSLPVSKEQRPIVLELGNAKGLRLGEEFLGIDGS
jgi:hypothetical protein